MKAPISRKEAADDLREQAVACRRLAWRARTVQGVEALRAVADTFDRDAKRVDPPSARP